MFPLKMFLFDSLLAQVDNQTFIDPTNHITEIEINHSVNQSIKQTKNNNGNSKTFTQNTQYPFNEY